MRINKITKQNWILISIVILAAILRLYKLSMVPPHLTPDEASLGYNAYSILKTGKDEYGKLLPIIFKSFGDYKPGLYVYLTVPFVAVLGLTELAVRLPGAIAGIFAIYLVYQVVLMLFKDKRIALFSGLLLAINPWHIHFSRGAWEANLSLTITLGAIIFLLKSFEKAKYLIISSILFSLTLLAYQGAKLSSLLVLLSLVVAKWDSVLSLVRKANKYVIASIIVGLVVSLPIIASIFGGQAGRLKVFSIFSYSRSGQDIQVILDQGGERVKDISYSLFHPEGLFAARGVLSRWLNHYSDRFLFFVGDWQNLRHSAPNHGMFLVADIFLVIAGFIALARRKSKEALFIFLWVVLAPLPAALSRDQVQAVRSLNLLIPLTVMSAFGVNFLLGYFRKIKIGKILIFSSIAIYLGSFIYFLDAYFVHLPKHNAVYWYDGYKQVVEFITPIQDSYQKIIFEQSYDQPYIYFLFYQKYDPRKYQQNSKLIEGGVDVGLVDKLDNISFESFSWPHATGDSGTLIVGNGITIPENYSEGDYQLLLDIKYPDEFNTAFKILEVK